MFQCQVSIFMESKRQTFASTDTESSMLYSQNVKNVSYKFNVVPLLLQRAFCRITLIITPTNELT